MSEELSTFQFHDFLQSSVQHIIKEVGVPKTVVEIGVFQGYCTFNMTAMIASKIPEYKHIAIDPFDNSHDLDDTTIQEAYEKFKSNLEVFPLKHNIEFKRTNSWDGLMELLNRKIEVDMVYIDGDHRASGVLEDLILSYRLVKLGGVILCDDSTNWVHTDRNKEKMAQYSPRLAVDSFIHCNWHKIELMNLPNCWQTAFIKREI